MNELLDLHPGQWNLLILPHRRRKHLLATIGHLAKLTPLWVLDCGRQFDASVVARAAGGRAEIMDRIRIQRAFICYEAVKLLEHVPAGVHPVLILDFLSTFYDENVKLHLRKFLLESSLRHFQRLSHGAGLTVTAQPPPDSAEALELFERLRSCASQVSTYEPPASDPQQMNLF
ncbi:MAG TPA: hypothetical protein VJ022_09585 [Anaerolineales bacterium]|nr:hypothetical protein [Anaerolineales bacterium]